MAMNRRKFLVNGVSTSVGMAALASIPMIAASPALANDVPMIDLMDTSKTMPDLAVGPENAPVTIVEYFSLTCSHCAHFHATTYEYLKEKYISKGQMRFVFREFPLDALAMAGAMLVRRAPNGKSEELMGMLLDNQAIWAFSKNPVAGLKQLVKQAGFTQEAYDKVTKDQELVDQIKSVRERGEREFGIRATPSFFFNGKEHIGAMTIEEIEKVLAPFYE